MKAHDRKFWVATVLLGIASVGCEFSAAPQNASTVEHNQDSIPVKRPHRTEKEVLAQTVTGKEIYMAYCVSCHREDGGGFLGPPSNLTASQLDSAEIREVIQIGRPSKGMMAYQDVLKSAEIDSVVDFVLLLQQQRR